MTDKVASLQAKKAYFARVQRSNYVASMRLEGIRVTEEEAAREQPCRTSSLRTFKQVKA